MTVIYDFNKQLALGQAYEQHLDDLMRKWFAITPATKVQQQRGIDRVFHHKDGSVYLVEYKADMLAGSTGNAFVETVSVDTADRPGWAYSSQATMLIYLVTQPETVYCIWMARLRLQLERWKAAYPAAHADNGRYRTHGILVPLAEFEMIASLAL